MLIQIAGVSASGKSTVCCELRQRHQKAHDADREKISRWFNKRTGLPAHRPADEKECTDEWYEQHSWMMIRAKAEEIAREAGTDRVFLCGTASNERELRGLFGMVVCLTVSGETIRRRVQERTDHDFGRRGNELRRILEGREGYEARMREAGVIMVDGETPVRVVVETILKQY